MKAKQDKYIDLNQFVHKNGKISWDDNIGKIVEFFYNGERHELEILERVDKEHFKIKVDGIIIDKAFKQKITKLMFSKMFYKPDYLYNIGNVVNNLVILEQCRMKRKSDKGVGFVSVKAYKVRCLDDGYEFISDEYNLNNGHGCPVCAKRSTIVGYNDVATLHPELANLFADPSIMHEHCCSSKERAEVICPYCGTHKRMIISEVVKLGYVTCDNCSDNISYPNKFAHELFRQLSNQYEHYECEYSPEWADNYSYDNYIKFANGFELIVEMDGSFHYMKRYGDTDVDVINNDIEKDRLCSQHNIKIIRVNCDYNHVRNRFSYIKDNIIKELSDYFDLSDVDWDKCDVSAMSTIMPEVVDFYNNNPKFGLQDIANHFGICKDVVYRYLHAGEKLDMCTYVRSDPKRKKDSRPVAMYDMSGNIIGIFKSTKAVENAFPECNLNHKSMWTYCREEKPYKGYIFKYTTYEEYLSFDYEENKRIA